MIQTSLNSEGWGWAASALLVVIWFFVSFVLLSSAIAIVVIWFFASFVLLSSAIALPTGTLLTALLVQCINSNSVSWVGDNRACISLLEEESARTLVCSSY